MKLLRERSFNNLFFSAQGFSALRQALACPFQLPEDGFDFRLRLDSDLFEYLGALFLFHLFEGNYFPEEPNPFSPLSVSSRASTTEILGLA